MRPRLRSALVNGALLISSIIVALLLCEAILRVIGFAYPSFYRPDPRLGLRLRPNAAGWYRSEGEAFVAINSAGFRDRERSVVKPAGTFRVAVLGDSMMEALQVDLEATFAALLERKLAACAAFGDKKIEVLNFGVAGYGTAQQLLTYRYHAANYSPDLVLLAFFPGNDVRNNSKALEPEKTRPFFLLREGRLVEDQTFAQSQEFRRRTNLLRSVLDRLRWFRVLQAMYFIKDRLEQRAVAAAAQTGGQGYEAGIDGAVYSEPATPEWRDAWAITERLVEKLRGDVHESGARLMLLSLSTGIQEHPDTSVREAFVRAQGIKDLYYPNRRIEAWASQLGVPTISLWSKFQEIAQKENVYFRGFPNTRMGTGHWNEAGHRMAADVVSEALCNAARSPSG